MRSEQEIRKIFDEMVQLSERLLEIPDHQNKTGQKISMGMAKALDHAYQIVSAMRPLLIWTLNIEDEVQETHGLKTEDMLTVPEYLIEVSKIIDAAYGQMTALDVIEKAKQGGKNAGPHTKRR